jgi:signal transduction histidine kinase
VSVSATAVDDFAAERLSIARELHDVISYGFATISLQAGAAAHVAEQKPQAAVEALREIKHVSKEALEELRAILGVLRQSPGSRAASFGRDRFEALAQSTTRAGAPTRLEVSAQLDEIPEEIARAAFRIVQEALTNVLRHAGRASVTVTMTQTPDHLAVIVEDDGVGPAASAEQPSPGSGLGLVGMRERALALGGDLVARERREGGFRISAYIPLSASS